MSEYTRLFDDGCCTFRNMAAILWAKPAPRWPGAWWFISQDDSRLK